MNTDRKQRFGMVIDLDRCTGCGACAIACAVENNVPPAHQGATSRTGITWMHVAKVTAGTNFPCTDTVYIPVLCQHCDNHTPCVSVCPQNAVEVDEATGIVGQIPQRCLGCRYCMTACPYHARYFNWWDPAWPEGMERMLNPDVAPRMRGVVEKCNFCHGRLHAAHEKAAKEGKKEIDPTEYVPACVENCPASAITFGDLADPLSEVATRASGQDAFRFLERLNTGAKVFYLSRRRWVQDLASHSVTSTPTEVHHG